MRAFTIAMASAMATSTWLSPKAYAQDDGSRSAPSLKSPSPPQRELAGNVVGIDEDDILVDLGAARGAADGQIVELWRPVRLRHPVTGQTLIDRFRIGTLRLVQVQKTLALARPEGKLARAAAAGDVVVLSAPLPVAAASLSQPASASTAKPSSTQLSPESNASVIDGEARELSLIFDSLKGQTVALRIRRYEQYAQSHPTGRYTHVLLEEAGALRALQQGRSSAQEAAPKPEPIFAAPPNALADHALSLAIETPGATGAVLHVRHAGEVAYQSLPMRGAGTGYFRATISSEQMRSPEVSYFIESVDASGTASAAVGAAESPLSIEVHDIPKAAPPAIPEASVAVFSDYADYNRLRANDYAWQSEGYFSLRYGDRGVRAVRSGFGVYRGVGGSIHELDELRLGGRKVGLTYGYLEGEFGTSHFVGLIGRIVLGLTDDGLNGGGQFFVRLGNDKLTNILLGGELLGGVGLKGIAELQWNTIPRVPIVLRTEVTNQPAGAGSIGTTSSPASRASGDVGARAMVQIGYRIVPSLTLALRASYEGRTIQHAGPGAGAGVSYTW
jgi:hypothetical protein